MSDSKPDDPAEPTEDPRACSRCGVYIGDLTDDNYCDPCAREYGTKPPMRPCTRCGETFPEEQMRSIDVSPPDEYYPTFEYLCQGCSEK